MDGNGAKAPRQLTANSRIWRFPPKWSPDGRMLLFADRNQKLQILNVQSGALTTVAEARGHDLTDYGWSPDSRWLVYGKDSGNSQDAVWVYSLEQKKSFQLTDAAYDDFAPVFSRDGKYIYFLSNRDFNLAFSDFDSGYRGNKTTRIYALALSRGTAPLFGDKNDMEKTASADREAAARKGKKATAKDEGARVRIDVEGCQYRVAAFPLAGGDYAALRAIDGGILYYKDNAVRRFNIEERKESVVIDGIDSAVLAAGGEKILYQAKNRFGIVGLGADQKVGDGALDLSRLAMKIEPLKEWTQIFNDGWRIFRDWFYQKKLHGIDWPKLKEKYARLVPFLGHRADLDFILGEMVGEVNAGHTYVNWGDFSRVKRIDTGLLGAELRADERAGRYVIAKIYAGENWNEDTRSPLNEQGVDVRAGDYLIAIDGAEVTLKDNPYRFLENTAGCSVSIKVSARPDGAAAREYRIKPVASELGLFYLDWVRSRRGMAERLSGGRVGYIHVPDTATRGNAELLKGMHAYKDKEALIIDDRYNNGGFIPVAMAGLLARKTLNYWARRGLALSSGPGLAHDGPKAMLINGYSSSGGDALPYYFKKRKLGLLIGTRTWGGLIGLSGNPDFVDGGSLSVPTFGFVDTAGNWAVEGQGVAPDIEVIDRPEMVAAGNDPCLEKAVAVLLDQLRRTPPKNTAMPAEPDRSRWIEERKE
jgi:tricorn protease